MFLTDKALQAPIWAQDIWPQAESLKVDSISDAAKKLKSIGKFWLNYSFDWHRRATLIQEQLRSPKENDLNFLQKVSSRQHGVWCLISPNEILYSVNPTATVPLGKIKFKESEEPPSRAYLKLWELFTLHDILPKAGQRALDLGSSPGGWTWVLQKIGCHVISVDKAPLAAYVKKLRNIEYIKKDAFKIIPDDLEKIDWLFSDLICYPEKLWEYLQPWIDLPVNLVCTIKFQGKTDHDTLKKFKAVPHSRIVHLFHNKHEVTWIRTHAN